MHPRCTFEYVARHAHQFSSRFFYLSELSAGVSTMGIEIILSLARRDRILRLQRERPRYYV